MLCDACPTFKDKYEQLKAKGEQQQKAGTPLGTGSQRVDVVKAKADAAGVNKATAKKVERVKKANPEVISDIAAGRTTANKETKKLATKKKKADGKGNRKQMIPPPKTSSAKTLPALTCTVRLDLVPAEGMTMKGVESNLQMGKAEFRGLYVWLKNAKAMAAHPGGPLPKGCMAEVTGIREAAQGRHFKLEADNDEDNEAPRTRPPQSQPNLTKGKITSRMLKSLYGDYAVQVLGDYLEELPRKKGGMPHTR